MDSPPVVEVILESIALDPSLPLHVNLKACEALADLEDARTAQLA